MQRSQNTWADRAVDLLSDALNRVVKIFANQRRRPHMQYCFCAMGRISKSCGQVTTAHIKYVEAVMERLDFSPEDRATAIDWFTAGKQDQVDFHQLAAACNDQQQPVLIEMTLECMVAVTLLVPCTSAQRTLKLLSSLLGVSNEALLAKMESQQATDTAEAHARHVLDVAEEADAATIKTAYLRLASRYHPDKLDPGATIDEREYAEQRLVEINEAYERLKAAANSAPPDNTR